jgi:hypothetical protein
MFPFAHLHPNAGAQLRKEIILLAPHLVPLAHGDSSVAHDSMVNIQAESALFSDNTDEFSSANSHDFMQGSDQPISGLGADPQADSPARSLGSREGSVSTASAPGSRSADPTSPSAPPRRCTTAREVGRPTRVA